MSGGQVQVDEVNLYLMVKLSARLSASSLGL